MFTYPTCVAIYVVVGGMQSKRYFVTSSGIWAVLMYDNLLIPQHTYNGLFSILLTVIFTSMPLTSRLAPPSKMHDL